MWCEHCHKDSQHGTGNCPVERLAMKSEPPENKNFVVPEGKVLISQVLYDKLMQFSARLDKDRESHSSYMRDWRHKRKANAAL